MEIGKGKEKLAQQLSDKPLSISTETERPLPGDRQSIDPYKWFGSNPESPTLKREPPFVQLIVDQSLERQKPFDTLTLLALQASDNADKVSW